MRSALFLFFCLMGRAMLALNCFLPEGMKLVVSQIIVCAENSVPTQINDGSS